ncbi:hypothetical protein KSF73_16500 [Burkholderiaceae bacterium DAT-1]|nr:hypothetical protein [Burkholderiaceae bacterium DAT-1]
MKTAHSSEKIRIVSPYAGEAIPCPAYIQRIDDVRTHGWQLRYGKWVFFSDKQHTPAGAIQSLLLAVVELKQRIRLLDAPTGLRKHRNQNKQTNLPAGISGPIHRKRSGRDVTEVSFGVTIPRFGKRPTNRMVYIGTSNTINDSRISTALMRAEFIRSRAVAEYQLAANAEIMTMIASLTALQDQLNRIVSNSHEVDASPTSRMSPEIKLCEHVENEPC